MSGNIPYIFDYWADPVVHILLLGKELHVSQNCIKAFGLRNLVKVRRTFGQWLWLSWQSGRFQRSDVRIQSSANLYMEHLFTYCRLY